VRVVNAARATTAVLAVVASAALLVSIFRPMPATSRESSLAFSSSAQCRSCHPREYAEWESSWHAQAWNDADVRALSNDFANTDCIDCHAPLPVFETGIGKRVLPRSSRRAEGVDCIACHALPVAGSSLGGVAGTRPHPTAACRPVATPELSKSEFCGGCHDQHKTVEQWRTTTWAAQGIGCIDCHMPPRGGEAGGGRDHTMHGAHDLDLVKRAVALRARREGGHVVVEVENVGAGHHFPTDERSRAADVFWRPTRDGAPTDWRWLYRFRSPYRHEVDIPDTLLPSHETRSIPIEDADASGAIEVALFLKLTPYWRDPKDPRPEQEARLVHRVSVEP